MVNRIASLVGKGKIEMTEGQIPTPAKDEVLIKVRHCGVCGSDVHNFLEGRTGKRVISYPFVLGHEFAGEIVEVGADVANVRVGDRVCVEPGASCGHCEYCKSGRYNLCTQMRFLSAYPNLGSMQDYVVFPARNCYKLPDNLDTVDGAMIEPLAVGLHAANRGNVKWGDTVLVIGSGCIGIMTVLACKAKNATHIIAVDVFDNRLEKAKELGATAVINSKKEDMVARVQELTDGKMADAAVQKSSMVPFSSRRAISIRASEAHSPAPARMYGGLEITTAGCSSKSEAESSRMSFSRTDTRSSIRFSAALRPISEQNSF